MRVDVGLELDGVGDPNPTFDKAWGWVENKLAQKAGEIKDELDR